MSGRITKVTDEWSGTKGDEEQVRDRGITRGEWTAEGRLDRCQWKAGPGEQEVGQEGKGAGCRVFSPWPRLLTRHWMSPRKSSL